MVSRTFNLLLILLGILATPTAKAYRLVIIQKVSESRKTFFTRALPPDSYRQNQPNVFQTKFVSLMARPVNTAQGLTQWQVLDTDILIPFRRGDMAILHDRSEPLRMGTYATFPEKVDGQQGPETSFSEDDILKAFPQNLKTPPAPVAKENEPLESEPLDPIGPIEKIEGIDDLGELGELEQETKLEPVDETAPLEEIEPIEELDDVVIPMDEEMNDLSDIQALEEDVQLASQAPREKKANQLNVFASFLSNLSQDGIEAPTQGDKLEVSGSQFGLLYQRALSEVFWLDLGIRSDNTEYSGQSDGVLIEGSSIIGTLGITYDFSMRGMIPFASIAVGIGTSTLSVQNTDFDAAVFVGPQVAAGLRYAFGDSAFLRLSAQYESVAYSIDFEDGQDPLVLNQANLAAELGLGLRF